MSLATRTSEDALLRRTRATTHLSGSPRMAIGFNSPTRSVTVFPDNPMQNREQWEPSKFVYNKGRLRASRDGGAVSFGSRLIVDIVASFYDQRLKEHARGKLLDLGCGKVPLYAAYRELVTDNICVDWSNTLHKNPHLDRELDLTKRIPFGNDEFDTIILSDVLEHIPVPEDLWKEMARLLAKNGKIIMNVPFYYWLHEQPHDFYRYTEFALQRFAEISGMRLIELTPIGGAPEILADVIGKNILRLPKLGPAAALIVQWCVWNLIKTRLGRKVSKATSRLFPLGYFLIAEKPF